MFMPLITLGREADGVFVAPPAPESRGRLFGGQLLAQCLAAAQATLPDDGENRPAHSLHGYFLRPGDVVAPLRLTADVVRDGRSFSSRQVSATQGGSELFRLLASFQAPTETPHYNGAPMPAVPPPEAVSHTYDDFNRQQTGQAHWHGDERPVEIRYVNPPTAPRGEPVTATQLMWMRIREALPAGRDAQQAALAYLSDTTLVDHIPLPIGRRWQDADFLGTSLDHAMWFHRPARADEWLLFAQDVEATGGGRGLASGRFYARTGERVATCVQEGLMRWRAPLARRRT